MKSSAESPHSEGSQSIDTILFLFGTLTAGALIRQNLKYSAIPYTVWLLLFGMGIGLAVVQYDHNLGTISQASKIVANIDPHLLLYLFLPPLVFESAFSFDSHIFKKTLPISFTLAVPGLLLSTGIIGLILKWLLFKNWAWDECLLVGAILSATDPVAVVSLLKTLGASKKLSSLIESESLLNDGTAVVVFMTLHKSIQNPELGFTISAFLWDFVYMSFGGVMFGIFAASISLFWLSTVFNDAAVEITITLSLAYLVFYISEASLRTSGVLSLVSFGLCFSRYSITKISPEVHHFLHEFWHMLEYLANTLVFVITGLIIVIKNPNPTSSDWIALAVTYIGITVTRLFTTFLCLYPFKTTKYRFENKDALICAWGGLRGAVGLALALVVHLDESIKEDHRNRILFIVAGIVIATLILNGSSMRFLINSLGMLKSSGAKMNMRIKTWKKLQDDLQNNIEELKKSPFYSNANWDLVRENTNLVKLISHDLKLKHSNRVGDVDAFDRNVRLDSMNPSDKDLWNETRGRVFTSLKSSFYYQYEHGMIGPLAFQCLLRSMVVAQDKISDDIIQWDTFNKYVTISINSKLLYAPIFGQLIMRSLYSKVAFGIDLANGFRYGHETVLKLLNESYLPRERGMLEIIQSKMMKEMESAQRTLYDVYNILPEICISVSTRHSSRMILQSQRESIHKYLHKGLIDESEALDWTGELEAKMKKLAFMPSMIDLPSKDDILKELSWVRNLKSSAFKLLSSVATPVIFSKGDLLLKQNDTGNYLFILSRGVVSVTFDYKARTIKILDIGVGATIGETSFLCGTKRASSVQAQGSVLAFKILFKDMRRVIQVDSKLEDEMWKHACRNMAENMLNLMPDYLHLTTTRGKLRRFVKKWELCTIKSMSALNDSHPNIKGEFYRLDRPVLLLHGHAIRFLTKIGAPNPTEIPIVFSFANPDRKKRHASDKINREAHQNDRSKRFSVSADSLNGNGVEFCSPCFFPPKDGYSCFFFEDSRVMFSPLQLNALGTDDVEEENDTIVRREIIAGVKWISKSGKDVAEYINSVAEDHLHHAGHAFIVNRTEAKTFFIIIDGWVSISAVVDGRQVIVDTKGRGSCIGELGYLTGAIRNATVTAKTQVKSLCISYDDLREAAHLYPQIIENLWKESSNSVACGLIQSTDRFNKLSEEEIMMWLSKWKIVQPDDSIQDRNSCKLPPEFILVYGGASISTPNEPRIDKVFAPAWVSAPVFRPALNHLFFHHGTRILIPTDDSIAYFNVISKKQSLETSTSTRAVRTTIDMSGSVKKKGKEKNKSGPEYKSSSTIDRVMSRLFSQNT